MIDDTLLSNVIYLNGPRDVLFEQEILDIAQLGKKQIVAQTIYSAISPGTELAAYKGDPPLRPGKIYPRVVGYCNVAQVLKVGEQVNELKVNDFILTFQSHRSTFICDQEDVIVKVPSEEHLAEAATTYLFHLGYASLLKADFTPGHNIAVIGLGTLGLATIAMAKKFGANVFGFSNQPLISELGKCFGAKDIYQKNALEAAKKEILELTFGIGIDVVITTSSLWDDWELALSLPRQGGTICVLGFPGRGQSMPQFNPLDSRFFYDKQLSIHACGFMSRSQVPSHDIRFTTKRNCEYLLEKIICGELPARKLITSVVEWSDIELAYKAIENRTTPHFTSILKWI